MKIICWNVNGIRAVERKKELDNLLTKQQPDIILFQETKASADKLSKDLTESETFLQFYHAAEKAGYSGTSIWVRRSLNLEVSWTTGMPNFEDTEGRIARIDFNNTVIFGVYFPNGGKSPEAWTGKMQFYANFLAHVDALKAAGKQVIWAGDVNCAHEEIDIARPKTNQKSIGFLPEERAWVSEVIDHGWVDTYRKKNPDTVKYSWWHMISKARERNVGWRIDYLFVDQDTYPNLTFIDYDNDQFGSDHCPIVAEIDMTL
ncbi:MAG: exodeoxyribonuclease III [Methylococcales bacterium]|jgi:exodeoxyribonuclease III|nr:exodeoxyribonuclease III [Methylococcales bacterium]MBT7444985.1 exodeoxyribonuclease III [Methylococcales bacterium]